MKNEARVLALPSDLGAQIGRDTLARLVCQVAGGRAARLAPELPRDGPTGPASGCCLLGLLTLTSLLAGLLAPGIGVAWGATLAEALNATNLTWGSGDEAPWIAQNTYTHDGVAAAQSGGVGDDEESWLETVVGPGPLCFWWKVSSERSYDFLEFYINGELANWISGEVDWQPQAYTLVANTNTLLWSYVKDESVNRGSDRGWVDQVGSLIEGPPVVVTQPANQVVDLGQSATFSVLAGGTPPLTYQWRKDGVPWPGATNWTLTFTSVQPIDLGDYDVRVANTEGSITSSVARIALPVNPVLAGQWPGWPRGSARDVAVSGDYVYVAEMGAGLQVIDVRNPADPVGVGFYDTGGVAPDLAVAGNYAYLAGNPWTGSDYVGELQVIDVSDPANPVRVGSYSGGKIGRVAALGNYAYLAGSSWTGSNYVTELQVIDVSNPANPVRAGGCNILGAFCNAVAVSGNYAYVAGSSWTGSDYVGGLQVIDVSNPANPVRLGGCRITGASCGEVAASGNYAYVLYSTDYTSGLFVIDVRNPTNPVRVASRQVSGWAYGVAVSGNYAYVAAAGGCLQVIDVRNPANPVRVGRYDTDGSACSVTVSGSYAYVADDEAGLHVISVNIPAGPVRVGYYARGSARGVAVSGDNVLVADDFAGLQVIDTSNPASPTRVGGYPTAGRACGVAVSGNLAYVVENRVTSSDSGWVMSLDVIDVSNPANPVRLGRYSTNAFSRGGVALSGNYAYVIADTAGLLVVDVSNPANPVRVGGCPTGGQAFDVEVSGNYAYVADINALQVIDVANPANPTRVGGCIAGGYAVGIAVSGNYAYVADGDGLQVVDVSSPANPVPVCRYDMPGAGCVAVFGNYAYSAGSSWTGSGYVGGLQVIDVSNPANPVRLGSYDTRGLAEGVAVTGNCAYVADGDWGLAILPFPPIIYTTGGAFGLSAGHFGFHYGGLAGRTVVVETSTNLMDWLSLQTNTLSSTPLYFSDPRPATMSRCLYRLRSE